MTSPDLLRVSKEREPFINPEDRDAVIRAALSFIPVLGGTLAEFYNVLFVTPIIERKEKWIQELATRLAEVEGRLNRPLLDDLIKDQSFLTVLYSASQLAVRTHRREKIEALANAVVNAAIGIVPEDAKRAIFLNLIERFTPAHLSVLAVLSNPRGNTLLVASVESGKMYTLRQMLEAALPEIDPDILPIIWNELLSLEILKDADFFDTWRDCDEILTARTVAFADEFLKFIGSTRE